MRSCSFIYIVLYTVILHTVILPLCEAGGRRGRGR